MNERRRFLTILAEHQHGLVARHQAATAGYDRHGWHRLLRSPSWEPLSSAVVRRTGSRPSEAQRALAAVLDAGENSGLYATSAAAWWGVQGYRLEPLNVVASRGAQAPDHPLGIVHTSVRFHRSHLRILDGVPLTSPEQTVLDLARFEHPKRVERALDRFWSMRLLSGASMQTALDDVAQSGRNGVVLVRELLQARGSGYIPPASGIESRFASVLEAAGERPMRRQVNVGDDRRWCGRVDFTDDELPLIVEVNSERYHASLTDSRSDEARYAALRAAGFVVVVVWDVDVWHNPAKVVAAVQEARRELRSHARPAA